MKTLMHICCAPCANRPIAALREEGIELAGFWYNPNTHPYTEYRSRKTCRKAHHQKDRSKARHQAGDRGIPGQGKDHWQIPGPRLYRNGQHGPYPGRARQHAGH